MESQNNLYLTLLTARGDTKFLQTWLHLAQSYRHGQVAVAVENLVLLQKNTKRQVNK